MKPPKILIIEDDMDMVETMRIPLEANGYEVESASNGKDGLEKVKTFRPDLIILDVIMAEETEGFHVAYTLKSEDPKSPYREFKDIPVIIVTALHQYTQLRFSREDQEFLPVDDFVEKPIQPAQLLQKVRHFLQQRKGGSIS